ncbi:MAG TPA: hypothetical protein VMU16_06125 [Candidatus Binataceae bacterium]|nr:hypothetical protein [Candidatus Binataceae bacterium]
MLPGRFIAAFGAAALVIAISIPSTSALAQTAASVNPDAAQPAAPSAAKKTLRQRVKQKVKALVESFTPTRVEMDREFKKAAALFPHFCDHWQQDLRDRETNNLSQLTFTDKDGYKVATYTGYGKIESCEAHQSKDGFAIGKLAYKEYVYYITGKSPAEARHAAPKPVSTTYTTEIFRWDKGQWFY